MPDIETITERIVRIERLLAELAANTGHVSQIDHGGLGGLTDDDHTQYVKEDAGAMLADPVVALGVATKQYVDKFAGLEMLLPLVLVPDLRGLWLAGRHSGTYVYDAAGYGRTMTVTGALVSGLLSNVTPYLTFDGANDEIYRNDEAGLDCLTGFSMMHWVRPHDFDTQVGLFNKWVSATDNRQYRLGIEADATAILRVSQDGTAATIKDVSTTATLSANTWHCVQAYYTASTGLYIRLDGGSWVSNLVAIPASIKDSARPLVIGCVDEAAGARLDGDWASGWLSGSPLSTTTFETIRAAQAPLFA